MKTTHEPLTHRSTYQINTNSFINNNNNTSPLNEQLDTHFQFTTHKPTFDYIADIKQINEELLSTNTTNVSTAKQLHHNTSNCSSLKIDDCSDIEGHPSSFIMQPSSSPRTSTLLSELTTNKINKYFNDSLMSKLRREYTMNEQRAGGKQRKQKCLFVKPLLTEDTQRKFSRNYNNTVTDNTCNSYNDEVVQLKCMVNTYKKLLDTLFYFINSLSHNYSFEKKFYQMDNYINKEDDLMKELLSLERCIQNNVSALYVEKKQQEMLAKLFITQEHSLTITTFNNNHNHNNVTDTNSNSNVMCKKEYTAVTHNKKRKTITTLKETKSSKECLACVLGASVSKRGYSPMKFNPYKSFHSGRINVNPLSTSQSRMTTKNNRSTSH